MLSESRNYLRSQWEIYKTLLWKEFSEQRRKLIAVTCVVFPFLLLPFFMAVLEIHRGRNAEVTVFRSIMPVLHLAVLWMVAPFIAMGLAGSEQRRGTIRFLQALPADMTKTAFVKLVGAILVATVPVLLLFAVGSIMWLAFFALGGSVDWSVQTQYEHLERALGMDILAMLSAVSLLLWMAAAGLNQQDEVRAGTIGVLVCVSLWLVLAMGKAFVGLPDSFIRVCGAGLPGGIIILGHAFDARNGLEIGAGLLFAAVTHVLLLRFYLHRYGRGAVAPRRGAIASKLEQWDLTRISPASEPLPPFDSTWRAIVWKQARETGPLVILAIAGVLVGATAIYARTMFGFTSQVAFSELLASIAMITAVFVLIVAGIGVFFEDLSPKLNVFWRSRPIDSNQWFGLKWTTGFLIPAIGFGSLLLLGLILNPAIVNFHSQHWWKGFWSMAGGVVLGALVIYCLSVCYYTLFRQAIYTALAVIGTIVLLHLTMVFTLYRFGDPVGLLFYILGWVSVPVVATPVAWLAIRHDWGWKEGR